MSFRGFNRMVEENGLENSQQDNKIQKRIMFSFNLLFQNTHCFFTKKHKSGMKDKLWMTF